MHMLGSSEKRQQFDYSMPTVDDGVALTMPLAMASLLVLLLQRGSCLQAARRAERTLNFSMSL